MVDAKEMLVERRVAGSELSDSGSLVMFEWFN